MTDDMMKEVKQFLKYGGILLLSVVSVLFGTMIKYKFHPNPKLVLNKYTVYGLLALWFI